MQIELVKPNIDPFFGRKMPHDKVCTFEAVKAKKVWRKKDYDNKKVKKDETTTTA